MQSTKATLTAKKAAAEGKGPTGTASKKKKSAKAPVGRTESKPAGAGGAVSEATATAAEQERRQLVAELEVTVAGLKAQEAKAKGLQQELMALHLRYAEDAATTQDVLCSQQREKDRLEEAARTLERRLEAASTETARLQTALQHALEGAEAAEQKQQEEQEREQSGTGHPNSELQRLQSHSRWQAERIAAQQADMDHLRQRLERTEQALEQERSRTAANFVRAPARSELRFVRECPWLVHVRPERLTGALPNSVLPGSSLALAGHQLLLEAAPTVQGAPEQQAVQEQMPREQAVLHMLDLSTGQWMAVRSGDRQSSSSGQQPVADAPGQAWPVSRRAVCSIGDKLLGVGGTCRSQLLGSATQVQLFHPSLRQWLPAPLPADAVAPHPPPRHSAALAYCPNAHAAFLYGGQDGAGACLGDLWRLDCSNLEWRQLDKAATSQQLGERARSPCIQEAPPASAGAALAVSEDGSRLWLMGGRLDSGACSSALHWFDLGLSYWARVDAAPTSIIQPRAFHAMACVRRFLAVAGGVVYSADGRGTYIQDFALYDPGDNSWDVLDGAAFELGEASGSGQAGAVVSMAAGIIPCRSSSGKPSRQRGGSNSAAFMGAGSCGFSGNKLLMLKAAPDSRLLGELWTVELQLPDEIEELQQLRHKAATVIKQLTLSEEVVNATSARLSWMAATANRDKLLSYKLMMTNSEGRARAAYEGAETSCHVTGLLPSSQYIFCVKALYDNASFQWSPPLMVVTLPAKKPT